MNDQLPGSPDRSGEETMAVERYFRSFADDYHRAFEGTGESLLHRTINRVFRQKTFLRRTELVQMLLERHGLQGKHVVDIGCGSGEVSVIAARLGAVVTGLDIVPAMVRLAEETARAAGVEAHTRFRVHDLLTDPIPDAEVALVIGVIEYYGNVQVILERVAAATQELLLIVDTAGPLWRRTLRRFLATIKRFPLYYRSPDELSRILTVLGFRETSRIRGHSFHVMAFRRIAAVPTQMQNR